MWGGLCDLTERHLRQYIFHIIKIYLLKLYKKVLGWTARNIISVTDWQACLNEWSDMSEEVIDNKITFVFGITGETYSFFLAYRLMHDFTFKFKIWTTRNKRSIDIMTPNKLAVYFVVDMVVADIDFLCGRYGFLLWPISSLLWPIWLWPIWWPIWFVADMVAPPCYNTG